MGRMGLASRSLRLLLYLPIICEAATRSLRNSVGNEVESAQKARGRENLAQKTYIEPLGEYVRQHGWVQYNVQYPFGMENLSPFGRNIAPYDPRTPYYRVVPPEIFNHAIIDRRGQTLDWRIKTKKYRREEAVKIRQQAKEGIVPAKSRVLPIHISRHRPTLRIPPPLADGPDMTREAPAPPPPPLGRGLLSKARSLNDGGTGSDKAIEALIPPRDAEEGNEMKKMQGMMGMEGKRVEKLPEKKRDVPRKLAERVARRLGQEIFRLYQTKTNPDELATMIQEYFKKKQVKKMIKKYKEKYGDGDEKKKEEKDTSNEEMEQMTKEEDTRKHVNSREDISQPEKKQENGSKKSGGWLSNAVSSAKQAHEEKKDSSSKEKKTDSEKSRDMNEKSSKGSKSGKPEKKSKNEKSGTAKGLATAKDVHENQTRGEEEKRKSGGSGWLSKGISAAKRFRKHTMEDRSTEKEEFFPGRTLKKGANAVKSLFGSGSKKKVDESQSKDPKNKQPEQGRAKSSSNSNTTEKVVDTGVKIINDLFGAKRSGAGKSRNKIAPPKDDRSQKKMESSSQNDDIEEENAKGSKDSSKGHEKAVEQGGRAIQGLFGGRNRDKTPNSGTNEASIQNKQRDKDYQYNKQEKDKKNFDKHAENEDERNRDYKNSQVKDDYENKEAEREDEVDKKTMGKGILWGKKENKDSNNEEEKSSEGPNSRQNLPDVDGMGGEKNKEKKEKEDKEDEKSASSISSIGSGGTKSDTLFKFPMPAAGSIPIDYTPLGPDDQVSAPLVDSSKKITGTDISTGDALEFPKETFNWEAVYNELNPPDLSQQEEVKEGKPEDAPEGEEESKEEAGEDPEPTRYFFDQLVDRQDNPETGNPN